MRIHRKQILTGLLMVMLLTAMYTIPVKAANQVKELYINVALRPDGSAYVSQEFVTSTEEGTEFYLDRMDSGYLSITDFTVSDENGPYTVMGMDEWDINAGFDEKAGKCGMLSINSGTELCWGITEYGEHTYTVDYVLHDLVSSYTDVDGFNYRFVDPNQAVFPTDVTVAIYNEDGTPLTEEDCNIWAFGYEGQIQFEDGVIYAWTDSSLEGSANMTIMVNFQKGMLSPQRTVEKSFEDVKTEAMEGSDYDSEDGSGLLGTVAIILFLVAIFAIPVMVSSFVKKKKKKKLVKTVDYYRDIPNDGNINVTYVLGRNLEFCPAESYLGARILRLIILGSLEPETTNGDEKNVAMRLLHEPLNGDSYDEAIYSFLQSAAGEDGVLQAKELENYCKNRVQEKRLNDIFYKCNSDGMKTLIQKGCIKGAFCMEMKDLTPAGMVQLKEMLGLKRYLMDFSLLKERGVKETFIWQDYMVYAMLFGIAEQVMKQMKRLYPGQVTEIETYQRYLDYAYGYDVLLYGAVAREQARLHDAQKIRSSGGGGSASYGGGGGFSGGGGMGTR